MNPSIFLWGLVATLVLTGIMAAGHEFRLSRMSIPFLLGTMLTADRDRALVRGSLLHLVNGWIFSLGYALMFESWGVANAAVGALVGLTHGAFVLLVLLPLLPALHPRMATETHGPEATRQLQPPGFMGLHYGRRTPLLTIFAHVVYGAILGGFYHPVGR